MPTHPNLITVSASAVTLAGVGLIARHRIHYWQEWARNVYDNIEGNLLDRLDVEPDMDELTT